MSNLRTFAERELKLLRGSDEPDEMQNRVDANVLAIVDMFAEQGHSGSSAPYVLNVLDKVLRFEPVTPLTGAEDEWNNISDSGDMRDQNNRCPHVFRRADGTAYDSEARVFRDPDGSCYTSKDSRADITFPYRPTREYVDVAQAD